MNLQVIRDYLFVSGFKLEPIRRVQLAFAVWESFQKNTKLQGVFEGTKIKLILRKPKEPFTFVSDSSFELPIFKTEEDLELEKDMQVIFDNQGFALQFENEDLAEKASELMESAFLIEEEDSVISIDEEEVEDVIEWWETKDGEKFDKPGKSDEEEAFDIIKEVVAGRKIKDPKTLLALLIYEGFEEKEGPHDMDVITKYYKRLQKGSK